MEDNSMNINNINTFGNINNIHTQKPDKNY